MSIADKENVLFEKFGHIPDSQERLSVVVDWARRRPKPPPELRTANNRVMGCASPVWINAELSGERMNLMSDAESPIVKGLVSLLCDVYDGATPAETLAVESTIFEKLGLVRDLSTTRRNGLAAARARIRGLASELLTKP
ncbi:MAG TPA: SufE family protein [Opitutaceae bacterium]|nr:SufE family protein [Opitutaceae bacterium]